MYGWCRVVHVMSKLLGGHSVTVSPVSYHYHIKQQRVLGWLAQCSGSGNWCRPLSESCHHHGGLFGRHLHLGLGLLRELRLAC